mmetsp:Transcript_5255/g.15873  ORF Transcript_5255/g.15873 Transcript_5255/m.15873 type:complete len:246 (-) Transcript_5255:822-1559(-)
MLVVRDGEIHGSRLGWHIHLGSPPVRALDEQPRHLVLDLGSRPSLLPNASLRLLVKHAFPHACCLERLRRLRLFYRLLETLHADRARALPVVEAKVELKRLVLRNEELHGALHAVVQQRDLLATNRLRLEGPPQWPVGIRLDLPVFHSILAKRLVPSVPHILHHLLCKGLVILQSLSLESRLGLHLTLLCFGCFTGCCLSAALCCNVNPLVHGDAAFNWVHEVEVSIVLKCALSIMQNKVELKRL